MNLQLLATPEKQNLQMNYCLPFTVELIVQILWLALGEGVNTILQF